MAGTRISDLPSGGAAQPTDLIPIARSNSTFNLQLGNIIGNITGNSTSIKGRPETSSGNISDISFSQYSIICRNDTNLINIVANTNTILSRGTGNLSFTKISNDFFNDNTISNSKLANMTANSIKVNNTSSAATPADLSIPQYSIVVRNGGNITTVSAAANTVLTRDGSGDITFRSIGSADIAINSLSLDRLTTIQANTILGNSTSSTGNVTPTTVNTSMINNNAVTLGKLQNIAANTILGNSTSSTGAVGAVTPAQLKLINSNSSLEANTAGITEIRNIVAITQANYTALNPKRSDTYYIVI